jgi:hypothetical protein
MCRQWNWRAWPNGTEPWSRRCDFHPESMPNTVWNTATVCVTIRIGARSIENAVSVVTPTMARNVPPVSRAARARLASSTRPSTFGSSTTAIVARNSRNAAPGSMTGQIGNSVFWSRK